MTQTKYEARPATDDPDDLSVGGLVARAALLKGVPCTLVKATRDGGDVWFTIPDKAFRNIQMVAAFITRQADETFKLRESGKPALRLPLT